MKQVFYQIIYNSTINSILRSINKFLSPILPNKLKIAPSGLMRISLPEGSSFKFKVNQTNSLAYKIFWEGAEKHTFINVFYPLSKKVNNFFDIGANIGFYSLVASAANPKIEITGFEPATGPNFYYHANKQINDFNNIKISNFALSSKKGEIRFNEVKNIKFTYLAHNLAGNGNANENFSNPNFIKTTIKAEKLDDYLINYPPGFNIELMKLDTEGTEHFILSGATEVLAKMKPIIICETLFDTIEEELEGIVGKYGFEYYDHTPKGLKKVERLKKEKDEGIKNSFFIHPSKTHLVKEFIY